MKLGTSSPLFHNTPEQWAGKHKSLGLEAIIFHLTCNDDEKLVDEYVKCVKNSGLTIAEVGIWQNTLALDEDKRKEAVRYAIGQLELADRLFLRSGGVCGPQHPLAVHRPVTV